MPQNRPEGWQFVLSPDSRRVLAVKEYLINENLPDKVFVVKAPLGMVKINPDAFLHDDIYYFTIRIKKYKSFQTSFRSSRHFVVD